MFSDNPLMIPYPFKSTDFALRQGIFCEKTGAYISEICEDFRTENDAVSRQKMHLKG